MAPPDIDPREGQAQMHNGSSLFWRTNEAGGRTYYSDEIGPGVMVWDTCLVGLGTLCEAISMELALQAIASRMSPEQLREHIERQLYAPPFPEAEGPAE